MKQPEKLLNLLKAEAGEHFSSISDQIDAQAENILKLTDSAELGPKLVELRKAVDDAEREILRSKVVANSRQQDVFPQNPPNSSSSHADGLTPPPFKLPKPPRRGGQDEPVVPVKPTPVPPVPALVSAAVKEDTFDISNPEQAKVLAEILQSPIVEIKRISATLQ